LRATGIAVIAVVSLAIVYAAFDMRRDHNQINRIREECQRTHGDPSKMTRMHCRLGASVRKATELTVKAC
jgi:hypothetical protein